MSSPTTPLDPSRMTTADAGVLPAIGLVSITERPGTVIGRYTLIESIGAGGFGAVFLAEQTEPVARRVALKVLKLGMDTVQVIARFEQERQALALMDHPHIAKVLDAGATDAGRPYFVMELVTGEPITTFCDSKGLSVRQRLELFVQVCNAIQHAHQKGIIHRDIKPSNILVSMHDGKPHARVIDFGIAKATEQPLTGETMHTRLGQWVGTPLYMSPEQSDGSLDVDTRSDVYSLGVLLYELLTGTTPFEAPASDSTMSELQRLIRDVDPPRPSTRVSTSSGTLPQLAASRSTEPRRLLSLLRGELDWVAMKAIEKEPERRYQTANGLANDLLRYLAGEPVVAAPPSTTYRLRKLVARNKGAVIAAAIVALALIGGLAGTLWQARAAAVERDAARTEAARATALNEFMREMLTASNPEAQGSRDVTVVEVLARASESAGKTLADQPEAEAEARLLLGETFRSLGRNQEAIAELERAVALREGGAAGDPVAHSRTLRGLALAHREQSEFDEALALYQRASAAMVGSDDEAQIDERITTEYEQALVLSRMARYAEAEQHLDASQALVDRLSGNTSVKRAQIITARAIIAENWKGDLEQAERLSTE
ncbi:MAG TPA: serine/threonine-protein kinase, partial [Thermoanaerobaculia bacterium]|nr:serine/threonine-protein kinase [Thermoanaerobaculia bacterium]